MRIRIGAGRFVFSAALLLSCRETARPSFAEPSTPLTRRALLIGIDDYSASTLRPPTGAQPAPNRAWPTLRGTVRDVRLMREMLISRYGFSPAGIVTLEDQQATGQAILQAVERHLVAPARKNDVIFFYYGGHGSQVANSASPEPDHLDESIVPADSRLGAPDIRDKQLAELFNRVLTKQARLTVVFDSCHSGSIARGENEGRGVLPDLRDVRDPSNPPSPESRGALVLSASKDFARAFEVRDVEGKDHGAFSWALVNAMRARPPGSEAAIDTFLRAQGLMRVDTPYQDAVLAGNPAARLTPLLSDDGAKPDGGAAVAVDEVRSDGIVILRGGWAHGLTVGTELRDPSGAARVRIRSMLGIARSEGPLVAPAPLRAGTMMKVSIWSAPPGRTLRVWIPQLAAASSLVRAMEIGPGTDCDAIEPVRDPRDADYILRGRPGVTGIEYAWVRPGAHAEDSSDSPLPWRTDWVPAVPEREAAIALRQSILRLNNISAWHHLESPPQSPSPYRLTLEGETDGVTVSNTTVIGRRYRLVLHAVNPSAPHIPRRYYYIFGIDSFGRSVLLFPRGGSVENQFPAEPDNVPPARTITVGLTAATAPPGLDTYLLISSDESLPNPWVLESPGVRTRGPRGGTGLEELLSRTGGSSRAPGPVDVSPIWSIDRLLIRSVPGEASSP